MQGVGGGARTHSILLVDDEIEFRQLAREILARHPAVSVVGEAANGDEALDLLPVLQPDAVVVDVQMPRMNGFQVARRMVDLSPDLRLIVVSAYSHPQYEHLALASGAVGFLPKRDFTAEMIVSLLDS